jgi:uroporphyrinogen decarboxylase
MNSRDRVIASIRHQGIDRIPFDIGSTRSTSFTVPLFIELTKYMGLKSEAPKLLDVKMFLAQLPSEISDFFCADTVGLFRQRVSMGLRAGDYKKTELNGYDVYVPGGYHVERRFDGKLVFIDEAGIPVAEKPDSSYFFEIYVDKKLGGKDFRKAISDLTPETFVFDKREKEYILKNAKELREKTDRAIVCNLWLNVFERGNALRGFENMLADIGLKDDSVFMLFDKITDGYIENLDWYIKNIAKYTDVICFSDDLGTQTSMLMSCQTYREVLKPYHKKLIEKVKSGDPRIIIFMHSCGAISQLIPEFIDIGVDVINPIQISAKGMDPKSLKKEYGKDIAFWGGACDAQNVLMNCTPEEVYQHTIKNISILGEGGGYVCAPCHNFQPDVPLKNILAFYEGVKEVIGL